VTLELHPSTAQSHERPIRNHCAALITIFPKQITIFPNE
jgi:hypothetical protein